MEKLEQNMSVIATLRDDIEKLSQQSKEKDSKIDQLQSKINKAEEDIKVSKVSTLLYLACSDPLLVKEYIPSSCPSLTHIKPYSM